MRNTVRLNFNDIRHMINEAVRRVLKEGREDVCNKLKALENRFGDIKQINLPDGVNLSDIQSEDIKRVTSNPGPDNKYSVMLGNGMYAIISPEAPAIVKGLKNQEIINFRRKEQKDKIDADQKAGKLTSVPEISPEEYKENERMIRAAEKGFKSMKQVQDYIEKKYGEHLEFLTTRTRRGHDFVYQARMYYIAASYADGPVHADEKAVEDVTKYLEPFGFYYAGSNEEHDERQYSSPGWHVWKRQGAREPYESYMMRQAQDEMEYGY